MWATNRLWSAKYQERIIMQVTLICTYRLSLSKEILFLGSVTFIFSSQLLLCWLFGAPTPPVHRHHFLHECIKDAAPTNNWQFSQLKKTPCWLITKADVWIRCVKADVWIAGWHLSGPFAYLCLLTTVWHSVQLWPQALLYLTQCFELLNRGDCYILRHT